MTMTAVVAMSAAEAKLDGHKIYYEVTGSGSPALVLVHGWTCDGTFFAPQIPGLTKAHQVVTVDLIGHGRSDKPDLKYDGRIMARSVLAAMDAAGVKQAVLVGHSMGLPVSRTVYEEAPSRVLGIVSLDGAVFSGTFTEIVKTLGGPNGSEARRKMVQTMFAPETPQTLRTEITNKMDSAPEHVALSAMEFGVPSQLWAKPISVPALAIQKQRSPGQSTRKYFEGAFTKLEFREMEGVGHFLMMEKPDEVNAMILAWVAGLK
jgi:pimeloyl-ACP methyl ester carboxylesterase